MSDAKNANDGLPLEIREALFYVGIDGEGKTGFGDLRNFAGLERGGGDFGGFGKFTRIFCEMIARRNVAAAHVKKAPRGDEVGEAVDAENSGDAGAVVYEADEGAGE